jgi:hypothetical protein
MARLVRLVAMASVLGLGPAAGAERRTPADTAVKVSSDGRDLEIKRPSDREPIRVPVLERCGDPAVGAPRIRDVRSTNEDLIATYGKHCSAKVSLKTLAVECVGCD